MRNKIIILATALAQKYGLNAFSYNDLSQDLGITKASIHHYFPSKRDLTYEILCKYTSDFLNELHKIHNKFAQDKLRAYINLFEGLARNVDKICLCMMYASDWLSLEARTQDLIRQFYLSNEVWLQNIFTHDTQEASGLKGQLIFSQLQGLLVRNRLMINPQSFNTFTEMIIEHNFSTIKLINIHE